MRSGSAAEQLPRGGGRGRRTGRSCARRSCAPPWWRAAGRRSSAAALRRRRRGARASCRVAPQRHARRRAGPSRGRPRGARPAPAGKTLTGMVTPSLERERTPRGARARWTGASPNSHSRAMRCQFAVASSWPSTPERRAPPCGAPASPAAASSRGASAASGASAGRRSRSAPASTSSRSMVTSRFSIHQLQTSWKWSKTASGRDRARPTDGRSPSSRVGGAGPPRRPPCRGGWPRSPPPGPRRHTRLVIPKSMKATRPSSISR